MKVYFIFYSNGQVARSTLDEDIAIRAAHKMGGFIVAFDIPEQYNFIPQVPEMTAADIEHAIAHPESLVSRERPLRHGDQP